jgi:plasmid stabilization system protein ParE
MHNIVKSAAARSDLVFYAVLDDGTISILRVLHSARRWKD